MSLPAAANPVARCFGIVKEIAAKSALVAEGPLPAFNSTAIGFKLIDRNMVHVAGKHRFHLKATFVVPLSHIMNRKFIVERTEAAIIAMQHVVLTGFDRIRDEASPKIEQVQ